MQLARCSWCSGCGWTPGEPDRPPIPRHRRAGTRRQHQRGEPLRAPGRRMGARPWRFGGRGARLLGLGDLPRGAVDPGALGGLREEMLKRLRALSGDRPRRIVAEHPGQAGLPAVLPGSFAGRPRSRLPCLDWCSPATGSGSTTGSLDGTCRHHRVVGGQPAAGGLGRHRAPSTPCRCTAAPQCCGGWRRKGGLMDLWSRLAERLPKDSPLQVLPKIAWADRSRPTSRLSPPSSTPRCSGRLPGRAATGSSSPRAPTCAPTVRSGRRSPAGHRRLARRGARPARRAGVLPASGSRPRHRQGRVRRADLPVARPTSGGRPGVRLEAVTRL